MAERSPIEANQDSEVVTEPVFGERAQELIGKVIETGTPAFITRQGKLAAAIIPITMQDVARTWLDSPEGRRAIEESERDLAEGRAVPASEAFWGDFSAG